VFSGFPTHPHGAGKGKHLSKFIKRFEKYTLKASEKNGTPEGNDQ
jgi:hypothetical protein